MRYSEQRRFYHSHTYQLLTWLIYRLGRFQVARVQLQHLGEDCRIRGTSRLYPGYRGAPNAAIRSDRQRGYRPRRLEKSALMVWQDDMTIKLWDWDKSWKCAHDRPSVWWLHRLTINRCTSIRGTWPLCYGHRHKSQGPQYIRLGLS